MEEKDLMELLALVRGDGRWKYFGQGLTSHPQAIEDENQQMIHAAMLVLEVRGEVYRHYVSQEGSVTWAPKERPFTTVPGQHTPASAQQP